MTGRSASDDATYAAWTREQHAAQTRNSDVRDAVKLLGQGDGGRAALSLLMLSLWTQCHILGIEGPTLRFSTGSVFL